MDPEIKTFGDHLRRQAAEDEAGRQAAAVPLPGPVADAFAQPQDIVVGPYRVRPFYDGDIEHLQNLKHPLFLNMTAGLHGEEPPSITADATRGPHAWNLCYLMTHTPEEGDALMASGKLVEEAKKKFSRMQIRGLTALYSSILTQMQRYWDPVLSFGAAEEKKEEAKAAPNPPLTAVPLTGMDG